MESTDKTNYIHFLVMEYWKLKDEQKSRIEYRDHMIYLMLGAIGAVFSFAIEKPDYAVALLVLPFICIVLGWTYLMNDEKTSQIDKYIRSELIPKIRLTVSESADTTFQDWEYYHLKIARRKERKWIQIIIDLSIFCVSAFFSLGAFFYLSSAYSTTQIVLAVIEFLFILYLAYQFISYTSILVSD